METPLELVLVVVGLGALAGWVWSFLAHGGDD